ncbi:amino acid ABC transporter permease [Actinokineospora iranica]|uniref:Amino acid ABC transporter membrane protein 2, PAAT family n=1 Tax=Actinokineospora iranica TaxID=1271860 RepID=A0A1G6LX52_9PSEU|nr:amino acid ABC transporter permease [Actinokineospora iranica]SDC47296.1 amino acid ABC transporter membrane protein 2, PAAT family [Actinokineospora iranica]
MTTSVLYDAPGPRSKRRVLISSLFAGVLFLAVLVLVGLRLEKQDQFAGDKWAPLFDPGHRRFQQVWTLLGDALVNTLTAAALAVVFSLIIGTLLAVARIAAGKSYRWLLVGFIELFRGIPVVIMIFFAARVLPELGVDLPTLWFLVIGLTAYNSVVIAEIVRAGVNSLPKGQREAAESLGMRRSQVLSLVLLPQAFRAMLPALISQLVVVLKDTSLGFIISYDETVRTAGIIIQNLKNPIQVYLLVAVIFILVNYALSRLAIYVERRLSQGKKAVVVDGETATLPANDVTTPGTGGG